MSQDFPLTKQEFDYIYSKVPRLNVEVLLFDKTKGTYLTLRDIEPCKGQWHLPGGTVLYAESLADAVVRVAKREINVEVLSSKMIGVIEYPSHYKNALDHPVGLVYLIQKFKGQPQINNEATNGRWFTKLPRPTHADQTDFLIEHQFITVS